MARPSGYIAVAAVALLTLMTPMSCPAAWAGDAALQSDWVDGHQSRSRLTAGRSAGAAPAHYAFIEISLEPGWKTYWRNPGDSGLPPRFDFARSSNVAKADVLYPAPARIADPGGDIIGYKDRVIFPVKLTLKDPTQAAEIGADIQFGICKDICVPSEASFDVTIPAGDTSEIGDTNAASLARVPSTVAGAVGVPTAKTIIAEVTGAKPSITLTAEYPSGTAGADAFVEAPDGLYLPLLTKTGESGNSVTFQADLSKDVDLKALAGKTLTFTLTSDGSASEVLHKVD